MKKKITICFWFVILICLALVGCQSKTNESQKKITLIVKTPPIGLGNVLGLEEAETYNLLQEAAKKFKEQYQEYDVEFKISRFNYKDEKEQIDDKYGTNEAVDVFFSGSWNVPQFVAKGWLVSLDDIIDEDLRADIDEVIWKQNSIDGKVYTLPFQQLQNNLMVNRQMMIEAGLEKFIPKGDTIAHWSTDEFNHILQKLKKSIKNSNQFAFMMYAANNQGDNHIMTLLRSYGGNLYDKKGNFAVNTPEGIQALKWIKELNDKGITPKGAENIELLDCTSLFNNDQLAICVGNLTGLWDAWNQGKEVFLANFPSMDGKGYATSSSNGFCVFDNGNDEKIKVAKEFVRFIYTDEDLMKYTIGTMPVNSSVIKKYKNEIRMIEAYDENISNVVDNIQNKLGWQNVRDVFYLNIQDLLLGKKTPEQVAASIDETCNKALEQGRKEFEKE